MHKLGLIFCLLLASMAPAGAQVSMTIQAPPVGVLLKNQLWNLLLINSSNATLMVRVNLVLMDEKNNQPVLTATSAPVVLPKGAKQLQAKDLSPIQYAYGDPAYHVDGDPNGLLPAGNFQACYTVSNAYKGATLAENCLQLNVDPMSPPLLNTPANESKITTFYPKFTWLPPTPLGIFNDLSYDLILVEVLPGQTSGDAIEFNIPLYNGSFLKDLYLNYPSSFTALDTGKLYAWRIVALNGTDPAGLSDVWTFRVTRPIPNWKAQQPVPFLALQRNLSTSVAFTGDVLKVSYANSAADTTVAYSITCISDAGNPLVQRGSVSLRYGNNFLEVPLSRRYSEKKVYLFQLTNRRQETWNIKFTWTKATLQP
jgi:hypothetical protein